MDTFSRNITFKSSAPIMEQRQLFCLAIVSVSDVRLSRLTDTFLEIIARWLEKTLIKYSFS